ncbi:MAG TPA: GlsB/YeaQ/YmgE family stress response membrane protein [Coriobacteriia bacterium]|nr:GlsB/YeaQ/YmgE family stress response membrane protein [Coriobacteriia bacterium]
MGIFSWLVVGLIAGALAKMIMGDSMGWIMTILLGAIGAVVGGWVFGMFGGPGISGIDLTTILVATVGAVVVLFIGGLFARGR